MVEGGWACMLYPPFQQAHPFSLPNCLLCLFNDEKCQLMFYRKPERAVYISSRYALAARWAHPPLHVRHHRQLKFCSLSWYPLQAGAFPHPRLVVTRVCSKLIHKWHSYTMSLWLALHVPLRHDSEETVGTFTFSRCCCRGEFDLTPSRKTAPGRVSETCGDAITGRVSQYATFHHDAKKVLAKQPALRILLHLSRVWVRVWV